MERTIISQKGEKEFFDINIAPINIFKGQDAIVEGLRDITRRKRIEDELKRSKESVQKAYNKAEFYKDLLAHDLNNILQSLLTGVEVNEMLMRQPNQLEQLKENTTVIKDQLLKASNLIANVRKFSKLEDNNIQLKKINICKRLKKSIARIKKINIKKEISIKIKIFEDISDCTIKANELLEEVFDNILINAIKHNKNPHIQIQIKISKEKINRKQYIKIQYIKIQFIDNAKGIEDSRKEKIFLRGFSNANNTHGMGLGLSLVRKIIEAYHGDIWVEDRVKGDSSKGSNFTIIIPKVDNAA